MVIQKVASLLRDHDIDGVYLIGGLDVVNNRGEFFTLSSQLYLSVGTQYIKLKQINSGEHIELSVVDEFEYEDIFEDLIPSSVDVSHLVFTNSFEANRAKKLLLYNGKLKASPLQCNAFQIELTNGQLLFFDPLHFSGLTVGGMAQKEYWINEYNEVLRAARGPVQEQEIEL